MTSLKANVRHDWQIGQILELFAQPMNDLLFKAHSVHRQNFDPNAVQISTLLNIKTGGCAENCGYCSQSAHHEVDIQRSKLMQVAEVVEAARAAQAAGATRFCMGAAWREPHARDMNRLCDMVQAVKALGLETCMTLGMLDGAQAQALKTAGLDYYNHNLDTSPEYYPQVVSTRTYQDRIDTLAHVRDAGMHVCSGGILGMGESRSDRASLLQQLANLPEHPQSVPMNMLVKIQGTPMAHSDDLDIFEFIRTIAVARILMPASVLRLSAGRNTMNAEAQALCFFAGANSIFYGERLLTTDNPETQQDQALFARLGLHATPLDKRPLA